MRYWSGRIKKICPFLAFIFCITVFTADLYVFNMDIKSCFPKYADIHTLSAASCHNKKIDVIDETLGSSTNEVTANLSSGTIVTLSFRINPFEYLSLSTVLRCIPFISWAILLVLLFSAYRNRMYLILFIHNSDGEKGETAGFLSYARKLPRQTRCYLIG